MLLIKTCAKFHVRPASYFYFMYRADHFSTVRSFFPLACNDDRWCVALTMHVAKQPRFNSPRAGHAWFGKNSVQCMKVCQVFRLQCRNQDVRNIPMSCTFQFSLRWKSHTLPRLSNTCLSFAWRTFVDFYDQIQYSWTLCTIQWTVVWAWYCRSF